MAVPPERLSSRLETSLPDVPSRYTLIVHGTLWLILLVIVAPIVLTAVFSTQSTTQVYQITNVLPGAQLDRAL